MKRENYYSYPGSLRIPWLLDIVAMEFGVKASDVMSKKRDRPFIDPRHTYRYILSSGNELDKGPSVTSRITGFDHASVLHACKKHSHFYETDRNYRKHFDRIKVRMALGGFIIPIDPMTVTDDRQFEFVPVINKVPEVDLEMKINPIQAFIDENRQLSCAI